MTRRQRREKWRKGIRAMAQSKQAKEGGYYDRAERRRIAKTTWTASTPNVTRVTPRYHHWMAKRVDAVQRGLIFLSWGG